MTDPGRRLSDHGLEISAIAAGALSVSEAFQFLTRSPGPGRRDVGVSLWQPGLDWKSDSAVGPKLQSLPSKLWLLGLGHLGHGYAWSIGWLNYLDSTSVLIGLVDDDVIEGGNDATGMLLQPTDEGATKARVVARELELLGMNTRIVERIVDTNFRVNEKEPFVALAGFDSPEPRKLLGGRFARAIDGGLGVSQTEYLSIAIHTFPSTLDPEVEFGAKPIAAEELTEAQEEVVSNLIAEGMPAGTARCGVINVGGIAIAAAFVGCFAGTLVVADLLRWLNGGQNLCQIRCDMRSPNDMRSAINLASGPTTNPGITACGPTSNADQFWVGEIPCNAVRTHE